jgi:hypothetical protein
LRRLLSILLLAIIGLPFLTPLLAQGAAEDASLPVCCRKSGKHHCAMRLADHLQASQSHQSTVSTVSETCPSYPGIVAATHPNLLADPVSVSVATALLSHPTGTVQTECKRRIAQDRSRQKRGPPYTSLL